MNFGKGEKMPDRRDGGHYVPEITIGIPESVDDTVENILDQYNAAYQALFMGVQDNIDKWAADGKLFFLDTIENSDKRPAEKELIKSLSSRDLNMYEWITPVFLTDYVEARGQLYSCLYENSVKSQYFGLLLSVIMSNQESTLAQRLLDEIGEGKMLLAPDTMGEPGFVRGVLANGNSEIEELQDSIEAYALAQYQRDHRSARQEGRSNGWLDVIALGVRSKFGRGLSKRKLIDRYFYKPLYDVAKMPTVIEQAVDAARKGMSLPLHELEVED